MNQVENYLRAIAFNHPAWVPRRSPVYLLRYYGCNHEGFDPHDAPTGARIGGDDAPTGARWFDIWGTGWHKIHPDVMGLPEIYPLDQPEKLASYTWPDPDDERLVSLIDELAAAYPGEAEADLLLAGSHRDTLWEKAYMLVGMEAMMVYFLEQSAFAREVLHHIMDFQLGIARRYLQKGIRMAQLGDDLGTQRGALLGPRIVREFLLPEYRRLVAFYKQNGVLINFHSCGNLRTVLPIFLELGFDVLNPVQATANDLDEVRRLTQGRMALQGAVSSAIIMEGPPERIGAEARQRMWQLGRQGGYICTQDQSMPYPPDHLRALDEAVEQFGRYPLNPVE
jgi:uroporphyrinogen decarboxylase